MSTEIAAMDPAELSAAVNLEVLGDPAPTEATPWLGTKSKSGNWEVDANYDSYAKRWLYYWKPVPLDGNQMMKGVRVMAERGWKWYQLLSQGDGSYQANFRRKPNLAVYRGVDNDAEIATYRAALAAVRAEEKKDCDECKHFNEGLGLKGSPRYCQLSPTDRKYDCPKERRNE